MAANVLSLFVNGTEHALDDGSLYNWLDFDGFGVPPITRLSESGPMQHGETDRGYRLEPRIMRLTFLVRATTRLAFEQARGQILSLFKPQDDPFILQAKYTNETYRIACHYYGNLDLPGADMRKWNQIVAVDLKAADPLWYAKDAIYVEFGLAGGSDTMLVPTAVPMTIGSSVISMTKAITYTGTFRELPIITITGPITDPVIENLSTSKKLDFTGTTIAAGDYYEIDLRFGHKTIVDSNGDSKLADLVFASSNLSQWALESSPDVAGGINSIRVTGTGASAASDVTILYYNRFVGI